MNDLQLQNLPEGIDQRSLETAVKAYAEANANVSSATITVGAKDSDGAEVQLEGVITRSPIGQVVFMVLSQVGKELAQRAVRGLAKRKADRLAKRNERRVANGKEPLAPGQKTKAGRVIAKTVEALFGQLVAEGMVRDLGNGIYSRVGGMTYPNKEALLDALKDEVPAKKKRATTKAAAPKKAAAKKAAPKKPARKK